MALTASNVGVLLMAEWHGSPGYCTGTNLKSVLDVIHGCARSYILVTSRAGQPLFLPMVTAEAILWRGNGQSAMSRGGVVTTLTGDRFVSGVAKRTIAFLLTRHADRNALTRASIAGSKRDE